MSRSQQDHIRSNKLYFGRHFIMSVRNAWAYFNETYHNYSCIIPSSHDTYDIFKVMGSKVKVADIFENALQHFSGGSITTDDLRPSTSILKVAFIFSLLLFFAYNAPFTCRPTRAQSHIHRTLNKWLKRRNRPKYRLQYFSRQGRKGDCYLPKIRLRACYLLRRYHPPGGVVMFLVPTVCVCVCTSLCLSANP